LCKIDTVVEQSVYQQGTGISGWEEGWEWTGEESFLSSSEFWTAFYHDSILHIIFLGGYWGLNPESTS
jgi:hypothetical protein